jgi:Malonate/sodium symporter MadM subunit
MTDSMINFFSRNGLIVAFFVVAVIMFISAWLSSRLFKNKIPGSAIAIFFGLVLAYLGGSVTGGKNGLADVSLF